MCYFWHAGILDVPGMFGDLAPVKGNGSALHCGTWQRTLTSLCSKLVREKLCSQHAGPWAQPAGGGESSTVCAVDCCASSLILYVKPLVVYCHQIVL